MKQASVVAARLDDVELADDPIDPDWIIAGAPEARCGQWSVSTDRTTTTHVWDCTAGRFDWYFAVDEIVHIIDGAVTVSADDFPARTLHAGDAALFRAGTWAVWEVPEYVRKHAILRRDLPAPIAFALRVNTKLRSLLGRG